MSAATARPSARRAAWAVAAAVPFLVGVALGARGEGHPAREDGEGDLALGAALYAAHCASCHGAALEGQPDWQRPGPDGRTPAPPHSVEGHTWHHADAMLLDYVRRGGQAVLDDMGVEFASGMPGFEGVLTDLEIEAVLDHIKSTWPDDVRAAQAARE